jgi:hypothetical protein
MFLACITCSPVYRRRRGSHASSILKNRPPNVDWSNRCPLGSYGGTWEAVMCSAAPAASDTAATPATAAARLVRMGTPVDVVVLEAEADSDGTPDEGETGVDDCCRRW